MIEVKIMRDGTMTNGPITFKTQAKADAWVASQEAVNAFGRPAGWYRLGNGADITSPVLITYDGAWSILLADVRQFEERTESETGIVQTWAKCKAEYRTVYTDVSTDADQIKELKHTLKTRVEIKANEKLAREYSLIDILSILTAPTPDATAIAAIQAAVQSALAGIAADVAAIKACTTLDELEDLKVRL